MYVRSSVALLIFWLGAGGANAGDYYVDADYGNDTWDGSSVTIENGDVGPKATIQAAIDAALAGDTITVADGIYTGSGNWDIDFSGKAITLQSANGPDDCIIDCQGTAQYPHRGFIFQSGENEDSLVEGFTIVNGNASSGAAVKCISSSPTITDCFIRNNRAEGNGPFVSGGAIACIANSTLLLNRCRISGNRSDNWGGAIYCADNSRVTILNSVVSGNVAANYGGGIYCKGNSALTMNNCTIIENAAQYYGAGLRGAGTSKALITNSIFWGNIIGEPEYAEAPEGISIAETANINISSSNVLGETINVGVGFLVDSSDLGAGNMGDDPVFVRRGYWDNNGTPAVTADDFWVDGDYRLTWNSPCVDAGDDSAAMGNTANFSTEQDVTELLRWDFHGYPRFADGDCDGSETVDIGAHEFAYAYIGDFSGECYVGLADLAIMSSYWLQDEYSLDIAPPAGDGIVDMQDFAVVAENWLAGVVATSDPDFSYDIDGDGRADATTDGALIMRYLWGMRGEQLCSGIVAPGATRDCAAIEDYLAAAGDRLDVDGNGRADAMTDAVIIIRYMLGIRGDSLCNGAIALDATRDCAEIAAFLEPATIPAP